MNRQIAGGFGVIVLVGAGCGGTTVALPASGAGTGGAGVVSGGAGVGVAFSPPRSLRIRRNRPRGGGLSCGPDVSLLGR